MKKLISFVFIFFAAVIAANAQKIIPVETTVSEISEAGTNFNIKVELKGTDQSSPDAKTLGSEAFLRRCKFNTSAASIPGSLDAADDSSKTRTCSVALNQKTTAAFYELILTFQVLQDGGFIDRDVNLGRIYKFRQQENVRVNLNGEPTWFGDDSISVPVKVDKDAFIKVSLYEINENNEKGVEIANASKLIQPQDKEIALKVLSGRNIRPDINYGIFLERADRYGGYVDINFAQTPNQKIWTGRKTGKLELTNLEATDLDQAQKIIFVNELKDISITASTSETVTGIFTRNGTTVLGTPNTTRHTYPIRAAQLVGFEKEGRMHTIKFTADKAGQPSVSREVVLIVDTKPRFLGTKISVKKNAANQDVLVVEYSLSRSTNHQLRLDGRDASGASTTGLDRAGNIPCTSVTQNSCTYIREFEINSFKSRLQNSKFGTFVIERGEGVNDNDKDIAKINFEVTTGLTTDKIAQLQQLEGVIKKAKDNSAELTQAKSQIANILGVAFNQNATEAQKTDDEKSIDNMVALIKSKQGASGKALSILKLAGKVAAAYFGLKF